jgi:16S rRNA (cytidine1402-2'-O)-methyltransferase
VANAKLYLIPGWLSEDAPLDAVLPDAVLARIRSLRHFVVEDAKSARRFLAACGHPGPMRDLAMAELNEHTPPARVPDLLEPLRAGCDLGLVTEAGMPAVADPGALLVAAAHHGGIAVVPLSGPSSILLALAASGLDGQRFRFVGYLPAESAARRAALAGLERQSARDRETQIFIETPYRNDAMLADILDTCRPATRLCVAADLTGPTEAVRTARVEAWRANHAPIGKRPAIFLLLA